MNVLFVYTLPDAPPPPARPLHSWTQIHMGISYISSVLKKAGHATKLVIPRRGRVENDIDRALNEFSAEMVCFTGVATEYPFVERTARYIRERFPRAYLLIGGPHASLVPGDVLKGPFDAACIAEGERAALEVAASLEKGERPRGIPNIWIKHGDSVEKNEPRDWMEELDEIPFPDRDIWRPWVEHDMTHTVLLGRGCPYNCTYCCNHALRKLAGGKYVRFRSAANVMDEVRSLCDSFPDASGIYFEVETITARRDWAVELCGMLDEFNASRDAPLEFGVNVRVPRRKSLKALFDSFGKAGFGYINIGIESGSERVRREVLKRDYSNDDLFRTCDEARAAGLKITAYNMVGLPGETPEDFKRTVEINRRILPEGNFLSIFYPYPGTELHRVCVERGLNVRLELDSAERFRAVLGLPEFPDRLVNHYFRWFDWYVYRGKKPLHKILSYAAMRTLGAHPRLFRFYRLLTSSGPLAALKRRLK